MKEKWLAFWKATTELTIELLKKFKRFYLIWKQRFWFWLLTKLKVDEGKGLSFILRILHFILFPLNVIRYSVSDFFSYDCVSNTFTIYGVKYSGDIFKHYAFGQTGTNKWVRIVKREDGYLTLESRIFEENKDAKETFE